MIHQKFLLIIEGKIIPLSEFISANTGEDINPIAENDMNAIKILQPGQSHFLPVHTGYTEIKRVPDCELTNYEHWQLEHKGNIIGNIESTPEGDLFESGIEELNRLAEWTDMQSEHQMMEVH